jgi:hypothetical protein
LPPGEGTILSYTRIPASRGRVSRVYVPRVRVWHHTRSTHAQVPLDGRLCQALSGAASGSIVLTVLRPTVSVDKLLRASTELMRSRRQQGAGASLDSALSGAGSSRHLASALSGAGSSAAVVPAAGGELGVDMGGGGDDGDALACSTTTLTATAGTRAQGQGAEGVKAARSRRPDKAPQASPRPRTSNRVVRAGRRVPLLLRRVRARRASARQSSAPRPRPRREGRACWRSRLTSSAGELNASPADQHVPPPSQ